MHRGFEQHNVYDNVGKQKQKTATADENNGDPAPASAGGGREQRKQERVEIGTSGVYAPYYDGKYDPSLLAAHGALIFHSSNRGSNQYTHAMVAALQPRNALQCIVAAQLSAANTLALEQAAAATRTDFVPELEHRTRTFGELSRCKRRCKTDPGLECAPDGGQIGSWELTGTAGLSEDESHVQAPFA